MERNERNVGSPSGQEIEKKEDLPEDVDALVEEKRREAYAEITTFKQELKEMFDAIAGRFSNALLPRERADLDALYRESDEIYEAAIMESAPPKDDAKRTVPVRVVGRSKKEQEDVAGAFDAVFSNQQFKELRGKEREKTPEDEYIIALANQEIARLRKKYGADPFIIPSENIHFIKPAAWPDTSADGVYSSRLQAVLVKDTDIPLRKAHSVFHESVHLSSFFSVDLKRGGNDVNARRSGLQTGTGTAFGWLDEAVTEELSLKFIEKNADDGIFKRSLLNREYAMPLKRFSYPDERRALHTLCEELSRRLPERFKTADEAFDLFAGAMFSGKILDLARTIDQAFGRKTFKRLSRSSRPKVLQRVMKDIIKKRP